MARLLGPDLARRTVTQTVGSQTYDFSGRTATVYADEACTTLANIATYNSGTPTTPGAVIANSQLTLSAKNSRLPMFWFPDGVDTVYAVVAGLSYVWTITADVDARLDALALSSAPFYDVKAKSFGAVKGDGVTDDTTALQAVINASPEFSTVFFPPGTYVVSAAIQIPAGRRYLGGGYSRGYGAVIKQKAGANITAPGQDTGLFVPPAWATNQTTCDGQVLIENMAFDGNRTNNPSSTASGVVFMNFWTQLRDSYIFNMPWNAILQTDVTANGTNVITNTASECDIFNNKLDSCGRDGFKQVSQNSNSNLDGNLKDNRISYMGWGAISMSRGAGWTLDNNHTYGIPRTAIDVSGCFATSIINNYIEDFGGEATNGEYYAGIRTSSLNGRGLVITGNKVFGQELGASSVYHYILVNANSGQTQCESVVADNVIAGAGTAGDPSHPRIGIVVQHSSGGVMTTYGGTNLIKRVATQRYVAGGDVYLEGPQGVITPAARKYKTGTQAPASGNVVAVTFDVTQYNRDTDYFGMGTANVITVLKDGLYQVNAGLSFTGGTTGDRTLIVTINGTGVKEFGLAGTDSRPAVSDTFILAANDVVGVSVYTVGGTTINGAASKDCTLSVVRLGN